MGLIGLKVLGQRTEAEGFGQNRPAALDTSRK